MRSEARATLAFSDLAPPAAISSRGPVLPASAGTDWQWAVGRARSMAPNGPVIVDAATVLAINELLPSAIRCP